MREAAINERALEESFQVVSDLYFVITPQAQLLNIEVKKLREEVAMYKQQIYPIKKTTTKEKANGNRRYKVPSQL
jgi:hypothetical protein